MKFTVVVEELQYALRMVRDLKLTAGPLADTNSVLVSVIDNSALITAYNGESLVKVVFPITGEGSGSFVVDASALYSAISNFKSVTEEGVGTSNLQFVLNDGGKKLSLLAKTKYARSEVPHRRSFALAKVEDFPDFSGIGNLKPTLKTKAAYLTNGVDSAAFALSSDKTNLIFTGMLIGFQSDKLLLAATNGVALAEYKVPIKDSPSFENVVVPGGLLTRISRCFPDDEEIDLCITTKHFFVRSPRLLIGGPLIREEYPDYKNIVSPPTHKMRVEKSVFLENVMNLSYEVSTIPDNRISLEIKDSFLVVKSPASGNEAIPVEGFSGSITIDCNLKILLSSLQNIYGEYIDFGFSSSEAPMYFYSTIPLDTGAMLYTLVVPLRKDVV